MWDWANDASLKGEYGSLSVLEKILFFLWASVMVLSRLADNSQTYLVVGKLLAAAGLSYDAAFLFLSVIVLGIFLTRPDFIKAVFALPKFDFKVLWGSWWALLFVSILIALGMYSLFLVYSCHDVVASMKNIAVSAKVVDRLFGALNEELVFRLALFYTISLMSRSGGFIFSVFFFAFVHSYNDCYVLNMLFAGALYQFLVLWTGSLSAPLVLHLFANSAIYFLSKGV